MKFLKDLLPALKSQRIFFREKIEEAGNAFSFVFKPEKPLDWKAGQHGIISIPGKKLKGGSWRGFSLSSAPYEGVVKISTKIPNNPSEYKQALLNLSPGDSISIRGPFGPFYTDDVSKPAVYIAGGIGITPYRSLILNAIKNKGEGYPQITLLYSDTAGEFVFKKELDDITLNNSFIRIEYLNGRQELQGAMKRAVDEYKNEGIYYISGPSSMIKSIKQQLREMGIASKNIRYEPFIGI